MLQPIDQRKIALTIGAIFHILSKSLGADYG